MSRHSFVGRAPKIPVPTLTISLPPFSAASKSPDIPILNRSFPSTPHLPPDVGSCRRTCSKTSRVRLRVSKSSFGRSSEARVSVSDPMVMSPWRWSLGQLAMICRASCTSSELEADSTDAMAGSPDFASSPEVLTCSKTLSGAVLSGGNDLFKAVAAFAEVTVWTA